MKRIRMSMLWIVLALLMFSGGCAQQAQVNMLEHQVSGLLKENQRIKQEIVRLDREVTRLKSLNYDDGALANIRRRQASLDNRLTAVQADILRLSGQVDMMQHQGLLPSPAAGTAGSPDMARDAGEAVSDNPPAGNNDAGDGVKMEGPGGDSANTARPSVPEKDLYELGQELFRQEAFMEAKQTFHRFAEERPSSPRAANAWFWAGECEYRMSRFEEAILEYQKVISKYPDSSKVPDALLKQGYAFLKLGDRESARIVLEKLVRKYPSSPQAITARKQIKRLK